MEALFRFVIIIGVVLGAGITIHAIYDVAMLVFRDDRELNNLTPLVFMLHVSVMPIIAIWLAGFSFIGDRSFLTWGVLQTCFYGSCFFVGLAGILKGK